MSSVRTKRVPSITRALVSGLLALCATGAWAVVDQALLERAEALLKAGKAEEAYKLLEPREMEGAGDQVYDFLLASAALDSGRPSKATFVYERILAVAPAYVGVRADMGRAYFALGDFGRAKIEFETVLSFQNLPPDLRSTVEQYARAAEARAQAKRTVATGYLEAGYGRDTNVGSVTELNAIQLPSGGLYLPAPPVGLKSADNYATLALGGEINHQLTDQWGVYAGGDFRGRAYQTYSEPGNASLDARAGLSYSGGAWLIRGGLSAGQFWQNNERLRESVGASLDWRLALSSTSQISAGATVVRTTHIPLTQVSQDFQTHTLTLGWLTSLGDGSTVLSLNALGGTDNAIGGRDDGNKRFVGARVLLQKNFSPTVGAYVTLGATQSSYAATNPLYLISRDESLQDLTLGMSVGIAKGLTLRPQLSLVRNGSNAELYAYDKADMSVNVRYDY